MATIGSRPQDQRADPTERRAESTSMIALRRTLPRNGGVGSNPAAAVGQPLKDGMTGAALRWGASPYVRRYAVEQI